MCYWKYMIIDLQSPGFATFISRKEDRVFLRCSGLNSGPDGYILPLTQTLSCLYTLEETLK